MNDHPIKKRLSKAAIESMTTLKEFQRTGVEFEVKPYPARDSETFAIWRPFKEVKRLCTNEAKGYFGDIEPFKYLDTENDASKDEIIEVTTPGCCPECLRNVGKEELAMFGGFCEECREWRL